MLQQLRNCIQKSVLSSTNAPVCIPSNFSRALSVSPMGYQTRNVNDPMQCASCMQVKVQATSTVHPSMLFHSRLQAIYPSTQSNVIFIPNLSSMCSSPSLLSGTSTACPILRLFVRNSLDESPVVSKNNRRLLVPSAHGVRFKVLEERNSGIAATTLYEDQCLRPP